MFRNLVIDHTIYTHTPYSHIILHTYLDVQGRDCDRNMFRCENGPCIQESLRCNGIVDCPLDTSDELDCRKSTKKLLQDGQINEEFKLHANYTFDY